MTDNALKLLIRTTETGMTGATAQYATIIGHNEKHLDKPVIDMTVDEIIAASDGWRRRFSTTSGAAGAYQIIKPTLIGLKRELNLDGRERFTPELQDRMADALLRTRGFDAFMDGDISVQQFGNNLAREWASFPVLSTQKRGAVTLKRGQSYYDKVAGNSALIKPQTVEATLLRLRAPSTDEAIEAIDEVVPPPVPHFEPGDSDEPTPVLPSGGLGLGDIILIGLVVIGLLVAGFLFWPH